MLELNHTCFYDFDCTVPGQLCLKLRFGNVCCSPWYGWTGDDCTGFSTNVYIMFCVLGIQALIGFVMGSVACRDVFLYISAYRKELTLNGSFITLLSTSIGIVFFVIWRAFFIWNAADPQGFTKRTSEKVEAEKLAVASLYVRPIVWLCLVFLVFSTLNTSVLWAELGYRAKHLNTKIIQGITYYRKGVYAFEFLFTVGMGIAAVLGRWDLGSLISFPFVLIIATTFLVGRARMIEVLKEALSLHGTGSESSGNKVGSFAFQTQKKNPQEKTSADRTRKTIKVIKRVSGHVIAALFGMGIFGGFFFLFNAQALHPNGWRHFARYGEINFVFIINELMNICVLYAYSAIFYYSHRNTTKLIKRKRQQIVDMSERYDLEDDQYFATSSRYVPGNLVTSSHAATENYEF